MSEWHASGLIVFAKGESVAKQITVLEAAKLAGVPRQLVWRRLQSGELQAVPNPRDLRSRLLDRETVERYFDVKGDDMQRAA